MVVFIKRFATSNIVELRYSEDANTRGIKLAKNNKTNGYPTLAVHVPTNIKTRLKLAAFSSNRTTSEVVIDLLNAHLPQFDGIIPEPTEKT